MECYDLLDVGHAPSSSFGARVLTKETNFDSGYQIRDTKQDGRYGASALQPYVINPLLHPITTLRHSVAPVLSWHLPSHLIHLSELQAVALEQGVSYRR